MKELLIYLKLRYFTKFEIDPDTGLVKIPDNFGWRVVNGAGSFCDSINNVILFRRDGEWWDCSRVTFRGMSTRKNLLARTKTVYAQYLTNKKLRKARFDAVGEYPPKKLGT